MRLQLILLSSIDIFVSSTDMIRDDVGTISSVFAVGFGFVADFVRVDTAMVALSFAAVAGQRKMDDTAGALVASVPLVHSNCDRAFDEAA